MRLDQAASGDAAITANGLGWRDRIRLAPWWVTFLISAVLYGAASYFVFTGRSLPVAVIAGLAFAGLMSYSESRRRQQERWASGCPDERSQLALEASLKAGEVPADPRRRRVLLALINRRRAQAMRQRKLIPLTFLLVAASGISTVLHHHGWWWIAVAASIVFAVAAPICSSRDLKTLHRHEEALLQASDERAPGHAARTHGP